MMNSIWTPPRDGSPFQPFFTRRTISTIILGFVLGGAFGVLLGWFTRHTSAPLFQSFAHARLLHHDIDKDRVNTPAWAEEQEAILQKALRQAELEAHFERKVHSFTSGHFDSASKALTIDVQSARESECQTCANRILYFFEGLKQQQIRELLQPKERRIDELLKTFDLKTLDLSNRLGESPYGKSVTLSANTKAAIQVNPALAEAYGAWREDATRLEESKSELMRMRLRYGLDSPSLEILDQPSPPVTLSQRPMSWFDFLMPFLKGAAATALIVAGFLYLRLRIQKNAYRLEFPKADY